MTKTEHKGIGQGCISQAAPREWLALPRRGAYHLAFTDYYQISRMAWDYSHGNTYIYVLYDY